jgi:hypothetical protein
LKRIIYALAFLAGAFAPIARAQAPSLDSVQVDSVAVYSTHKHSFFTATRTVTDTVEVARPLASGVDTATVGDTTYTKFWSEQIVKITDSTKVRVAAPSTTVGVPYGPSGYLQETSSGSFTFAPNESANKDAFVMDAINEARARGVPTQLALPCGAHSSTNLGWCLEKTAAGVIQFSQARFDSALARTLTPATRAEIVKAHRDGIVTSILLFDEPWVKGGDDGAGSIVGNTWGPKGMTRAFVDVRCAQVKALLPGVPVGTSDHLTAYDSNGATKVCDFGQFQYSHRFGDVVAWRNAALARGKRDGYQVTFSMNVINGGTQDRDGTYDCVGSQFGPKGQRSPNCGMTEAQIKNVLDVLLGHGAGGQMMWRFDAVRYARADWTRAFNYGLALAKTRPYTPLRVR